MAFIIVCTCLLLFCNSLKDVCLTTHKSLLRLYITCRTWYCTIILAYLDTVTGKGLLVYRYNDHGVQLFILPYHVVGPIPSPASMLPALFSSLSLLLWDSYLPNITMRSVRVMNLLCVCVCVCGQGRLSAGV